MTAVALPTLHHIALTVTDLDASARWYGEVFGLSVQTDVPHQGGVGRILADDSRRLMIALHRHDTADGVPFRETRTGLDHVGFLVPTRTDLEASVAPGRARGNPRTRRGPAAHSIPYRRRVLRVGPGVPGPRQHPA